MIFLIIISLAELSVSIQIQGLSSSYSYEVLNDRAVWDDIKNYVKDIKNKVNDIPNNFNNLKNSITSKFNEIGDKIKPIASMFNALKDLFKKIKRVIDKVIGLWEESCNITSMSNIKFLSNGQKILACKAKKIFDYMFNVKVNSNNEVSFIENQSARSVFFEMKENIKADTTRLIEFIKIDEVVDGTRITKTIPFWKITTSCEFAIRFSQALDGVNSFISDLLSAIDSNEPSGAIAQMKMVFIKLLLNPVQRLFISQSQIECTVYG